MSRDTSLLHKSQPQFLPFTPSAASKVAARPCLTLQKLLEAKPAGGGGNRRVPALRRTQPAAARTLSSQHAGALICPLVRRLHQCYNKAPGNTGNTGSTGSSRANRNTARFHRRVSPAGSVKYPGFGGRSVIPGASIIIDGSGERLLQPERGCVSINLRQY